MSALKPFASTLCLIALLLGNQFSLEGKHAGLSTPEGAVNDSCRPELSGTHFSIYCLDNTPAALLTAPEVKGVCGTVTSLIFKEHFIDLGCGSQGFTGYFSPSGWMVSKINGDGGVDVTGAPNALSVEGAGNAMVEAATGERTRMQIRVPADGTVAFNWRNVGGSNLFSEEFRVQVGERAYAPVRRAQNGGRFRCPVRSGDLLTLEFAPRQAATIEIERFRLLSEAGAVIRRRWTATDRAGHTADFTQFISVNRPSISDVLFPSPTDMVRASAGNLLPASTGYPYIDRDGNPATADDRHYLSGADACQFEVTYTDDLQQTSEGTFLHRHWTVTDACKGNTMRETQIIRLTSEPSSGQFPENNLYRRPKDQLYDHLAAPGFSGNHRRRPAYIQELMTL